MRLADRVADYLLGTNQLDERFRRIVRPASVAPIPSCQLELATRLAQWLGSGARQAKLLNLLGQPDSGRLALAQAACQEAAIGLLVLEPHALAAAGPERGELLALLEREAVLADAVFYLDLDDLKPDESQVLLKELERFAAPLIIASRERLSFDREMLAVPVRRPGAQSQCELWKQTLGRSSVALDRAIESIVEQFDLGPGGIARAVALAQNLAALRGSGNAALNFEDLWQACHQQTAPQLEQWAGKVELCYDWDDIVVPREVLRQMHEITGQVSHRHAVYQGWGFGRKLSRSSGISALFSGASGPPPWNRCRALRMANPEPSDQMPHSPADADSGLAAASSAALPNETAQLQRLLAESKDSERKARQALGVLASIIKHLPVGVTVQAEDGKPLFANDMAAEFSGSAPADAPPESGEAAAARASAPAVTMTEDRVAGAGGERRLKYATGAAPTTRRARDDRDQPHRAPAAEVELSRRTYCDDLTGLQTAP